MVSDLRSDLSQHDPDGPPLLCALVGEDAQLADGKGSEGALASPCSATREQAPLFKLHMWEGSAAWPQAMIGSLCVWEVRMCRLGSSCVGVLFRTWLRSLALSWGIPLRCCNEKHSDKEPPCMSQRACVHTCPSLCPCVQLHACLPASRLVCVHVRVVSLF